MSFFDDKNNLETLTSEATAAGGAEAQLSRHRSAHHQRDGPGGRDADDGNLGEILTAHTSDIADADGMSNAEFGFNWWAPEGLLRVTGVNKTYRVQSRDVGFYYIVIGGLQE